MTNHAISVRPKFLNKIFSGRPKWQTGTRREFLMQAKKDNRGYCICYFCQDSILPHENLEIHHITPWQDIKGIAKDDPELWLLDYEAAIEARTKLFNDTSNLAAAHEDCHRNYERQKASADLQNIMEKELMR